MSIYLEAAEYADRNKHMPSCCAIASIVDTDSVVPEINAYAYLFKPYQNTTNSITCGYQWGDTNEEIKQCRVLALLFMHWIDNEKPAKKAREK